MCVQFVDENPQRLLNWLSRNMRYSKLLTDTVRREMSDWILRYMIGIEIAVYQLNTAQPTSLVRTARAPPTKQRPHLKIATQHQPALLPNADERAAVHKLLIHMVASSQARAALYHIGQKDFLRVITSTDEMDKSVRTTVQLVQLPFRLTKCFLSIHSHSFFITAI